MTRTRLPILCVCVLMLAVAGCGDEGGQQAAQGPGQRPGGPGGAGGRQAIPVAVTPSFAGDIASYYKATATLEAEKQADVLARVSGVVQQLHAEEGDLVAAGDPLLAIENAEYALRVRQAAATVANLRSRYERLQAMKAEQLATEEEYLAAKSELASAEADEGLARLNLGYTTVRAPFAGRITARLVDPGQNLSINAPLFNLADFDPLLARVHVPSREFNKLQQDQLVDLVLDSDGTRLEGRIKLISPVIDPASGTIKLTVEVAGYPAGTRPGDFAEVQIVTELRRGVTLVPRAAVITDKGEQVVYVAAAGEDGVAAERRVVSVGFTDENHAQILGGLDVGETVVTKGQRSLQHGTPLKILEGEAPTVAAGESRAGDDGPRGGKRKTAGGRKAGDKKAGEGASN